MSLITRMSFFENGLKAKVMSTELIIEANIAKRVLFEALEIVKKFEATYSAYKEESLVGLINKYAGIKSISCCDEKIELFEKALEIAKLSDGVFDPTIGALTQGVYGFGTSHRTIPTKQSLAEAQKLVNYKNFIVRNNEVFLQKEGMRLDLGGIGKGFIADKITRFLQKKGATRGLVSVGGEIVTFGKEYAIAIKNPFTDGNIAIIKSQKNALCIATSGDYERYIGSKEHHHILDHKTAKQNHFYSSITLIKSGIDATTLDGLTTLAFNVPPQELQKIAKKFAIAIFAITQDKEIFIKNFEHLEIKKLILYQF